MIDLLRTKRTYKTREAAVSALRKIVLTLENQHRKECLPTVRYIIAVNEEGRFAPVVVGAHESQFIHANVTVVG